MDIIIKIKDKTFYSFEEFGKNIYLYPEEAFTLVKSQKFLNFLYNCDKNMYNRVVKLISSPFSKDAVLFKIQYIFNPFMEIRHHGYLFNDFESLGKKIISYGPKTDIYLMDFLKYNLLSYYMEITDYDKKEPVIYKKVKELEKEFVSNENRAYFKLGFMLKADNTISYNGKKFENPKDFMNFVINPVNISGFAATFIKSQYVFAWLETLGYDNQIRLFENLVASVEQKENLNDNLRKI